MSFRVEGQATVEERTKRSLTTPSHNSSSPNPNRNPPAMAINEANLMALIENSTDLILSVNEEGQVLVANTEFVMFAQALWGLEVRRGMPLMERIPPQTNWQQWFQLALNGTSLKRNTCFELEIGPLHLELSFNPIRDRTGISGVTVFGKDITDQQKVLDQIHAQEQLLSSINYSIQEGIFRSSPGLGILYVNKAFVEMFGYESEDEVMQLEPYALYRDKHRRDDFVQIMQTKSSFINEEVAFKRKDGSIFYGLISSIKSHGKEGEVYYDGAIRDVTELRRQERQLHQQNDELTKVNQELDAFVYRSSHDLRAPLLSLQGLINITKLSETEKERGKYLDLMSKSVSKLDQFILDITDYSRNARMEVKVQPIDFTGLIQTAFDQIQFIPAKNSFENSLTLSGNAPFFSDPMRLGMIFNNIISNAVRYRDEQKDKSHLKIAITVNAKEAVLQFRDNGQGIPQKHQEKVFKMFYRANQLSDGSGIGLYIVQEAVEKLGGRIGLRSTEGQGTTFCLRLPNAQPTVSS